MYCLNVAAYMKFDAPVPFEQHPIFQTTSLICHDHFEF